MKIILTDSGLGGLSICANVVKKIKSISTNNDIEILYINAVPRTRDGFNVISSIDEQVKMFNNFLNNISNLYKPHAIYVACNSLSALLHKTEFYRSKYISISGIKDIGVAYIVSSFKKNSNSKIIILGAETTIRENIYHRELNRKGIPEDRIISQSCPELANTISNDPKGDKVYELIEKYLFKTLKKINSSTDKIIVYLGCTHYGYRTELFKKYLDKNGINYMLINPNIKYSKLIISNMQIEESKVSNIEPKVSFITHYPIPQNEINTLTQYLNNISLETVRAFQNFIVEDSLY
jgi:glutamate racemase